MKILGIFLEGDKSMQSEELQNKIQEEIVEYKKDKTNYDKKLTRFENILLLTLVVLIIGNTLLAITNSLAIYSVYSIYKVSILLLVIFGVSYDIKNRVLPSTKEKDSFMTCMLFQFLYIMSFPDMNMLKGDILFRYLVLAGLILIIKRFKERIFDIFLVYKFALKKDKKTNKSVK